jgi:hypothetical protein
MAKAALNAVLRRLLSGRGPSRPPDRQLLERFIAHKDEAAFAALVERHGAMVLVVAPVKAADLLLTNLTGHPTAVLPRGFHEGPHGEVPAAIKFNGDCTGRPNCWPLPPPSSTRPSTTCATRRYRTSSTM